MSSKAVCCLGLSVMLPLSVAAEIYQWHDQHGRPHYSDRKHDNSRILAVDRVTSYHVVKKVFDGDTVLLDDGQKVRFLSINTPEVAGRNRIAEAGGEEAKTWLMQRLTSKKVKLEFDVERKDKYGRTLAYVFSDDGQQVNLELVRRGLAAVNIYPPNLKYVDMLLSAQREAQVAGLGIWKNPAYAPLHVESLDNDYKGWKRVRGRIRGVKKTAKYRYLQFSDRMAVRIEKKSLGLFPDLSAYIGQSVEVRGWLFKQKHRLVLPVLHPAQIEFRNEVDW